MAKSRRIPYLVCYDICEPRRLARVHRRMKHWGFPLQYSVFYCWLTPPEHNRLAQELTELIDHKADDVRIYAVQESRPARWLGHRPLPEGVQLLGLAGPWGEHDDQSSAAQPTAYGS